MNLFFQFRNVLSFFLMHALMRMRHDKDSCNPQNGARHLMLVLAKYKVLLSIRDHSKSSLRGGGGGVHLKRTSLIRRKGVKIGQNWANMIFECLLCSTGGPLSLSLGFFQDGFMRDQNMVLYSVISHLLVTCIAGCDIISHHAKKIRRWMLILTFGSWSL